jgi:serine/threonine protein kinase
LRANHILIKKVQDILIPLCINYGAKELLSDASFVNYEYLAPEQLEEERKLEISIQTDIWSLGVLIYELFTGQLPFGKKSPQSPNKKIQSRILYDEIPSLIDKIPQPYRKIVEKCLEKKTEDRWENIDEIKMHVAEHPLKAIPKTRGILETLEKMEDWADDDTKPTSNTDKTPLFQRKIKRKPSRPVSWLEVFLWLAFVILVGYLLSVFS